MERFRCLGPVALVVTVLVITLLDVPARSRAPLSSSRSSSRTFSAPSSLFKLRNGEYKSTVPRTILTPNAARTLAGPVPYEEGRYDPVAAEEFFKARPWMTYSRGMNLAIRLGFWSWGTFVLDKNMGKSEQNKEFRSRELLDIINEVGPTAIKIGQALSIRSDIVDPVYATTLSELQDKVPPFSSEVAKSIIEAELGLKEKGGFSSVFESLSDEPVAAASIGQVYKGVLRDGRVVAVKVQRPGVLNQISLDLHIARQFAPTYKKILKANTDLVGLVDEWGGGFIKELDYIKEAENTKAFTKAMKERGLDAVSAPTVIDELSSKHVLTTEWVDGVRLDRAEEEDAARLCGVALNAYLTMLLDTGVLHCDPHPGNLIRTPEGRLCILDFGMTTSVREDLQYALLDYIAHLIQEDYVSITDDLVKLGFVPKGQEDEIRRSGVVEVLSFTLRQLSKGGGAKQTQQRMIDEMKAKYGNISREEMRQKFRETLNRDRVGVADVGRKMEEIQEETPNLFQIPVWMAYILRAFSVLEGIGLKANADYSIVNECYPYLARRLLTDEDPRASKALKSLLYGGKEQLDMKQLTKMSQGFSSFSKRTTSVQESKGVQAAIDEVVSILLSPKGNVVQNLVLEQVSAFLDATSRSFVSQALSTTPGNILRSALKTQRSVTQNLPDPLRFALSPVLFPGDLVSSLYPLIETKDEDQLALDNFQQILSIANGINESPESTGGVTTVENPTEGTQRIPVPASFQQSALVSTLQQLNQTQVQEFLTRYRDLTPGAQATGLRLVRTVLQRVRERALDASAAVESRAQLQMSQQTAKRLISAIDQILNVADSRLKELESQAAKSAGGTPPAAAALIPATTGATSVSRAQ
mmetsp:Transcript_1437/g.2040  ORF Transcript_1437/g.2040 Transcript_1437/m.2040 type:complete len:869 (-) Transcript_1437:123-2729(-)|eukprot:CAMPEP_0167758786 /NCGR_PEP_ID=MMETSP0110_2-20121227/10659_1 /TAXON_ID=629695 /ORGANISM="Gymnochlora sp., Strain CCMP2014" /LENGTH=868 /DNA_ID=CAMNT_0007645095 /DNA_START=50 /DNA_END=2656 /DNA_ORIENTATION=-